MQTLLPSEHRGRQTVFKISIIIITVFIKEPYTLEKSCRKWSLTVCIELQRDRDTFVRNRGRRRGVRERQRGGTRKL